MFSPAHPRQASIGCLPLAYRVASPPFRQIWYSACVPVVETPAYPLPEDKPSPTLAILGLQSPLCYCFRLLSPSEPRGATTIFRKRPLVGLGSGSTMGITHWLTRPGPRVITRCRDCPLRLMEDLDPSEATTIPSLGHAQVLITHVRSAGCMSLSRRCRRKYPPLSCHDMNGTGFCVTHPLCQRGYLPGRCSDRPRALEAWGGFHPASRNRACTTRHYQRCVVLATTPMLA